MEASWIKNEAELWENVECQRKAYLLGQCDLKELFKQVEEYKEFMEGKIEEECFNETAK